MSNLAVQDQTSNDTSEIHLKMGHSRTIFKVNQDHGNHDRLAIENGDFGRTSQIFAPDVFNAPRG